MADAQGAFAALLGLGIAGMGTVIVIGAVTNRDPFTRKGDPAGRTGWFVAPLTGKGIQKISDAPQWFGDFQTLIPAEPPGTDTPDSPGGRSTEPGGSPPEKFVPSNPPPGTVFA